MSLSLCLCCFGLVVLCLCCVWLGVCVCLVSLCCFELFVLFCLCCLCVALLLLFGVVSTRPQQSKTNHKPVFVSVFFLQGCVVCVGAFVWFVCFSILCAACVCGVHLCCVVFFACVAVCLCLGVLLCLFVVCCFCCVCFLSLFAFIVLVVLCVCLHFSFGQPTFSHHPLCHQCLLTPVRNRFNQSINQSVSANQSQHNSTTQTQSHPIQLLLLGIALSPGPPASFCLAWNSA